jgi:hypothetical protein
MKRKFSRSNKILGMAYWQVGILFAMGICAIVTIGSIFAFIGYSNLYVEAQDVQQSIPTSITPTTTRISPSRVPMLTSTVLPTRTILPTATMTLTPTPWFQGFGDSYIPEENEVPSGYMIYVPGSGSSQDDQGWYKTVVYTSDYPNTHRTEDAYLVSYSSWIYKTDNAADLNYEGLTSNWITRNWREWINVSQEIKPVQVDFNASGVEKSAAYFATYNGASVPEAFVLVKLQSHNAVFIIRTLSHSPSGDQQRAIANAYYFASLLIQKLNR